MDELFRKTHERLAVTVGGTCPPEDVDRMQRAYVPPAWVTGNVNVYDALFLYEMVRRIRPDTVIEIGTASGVSSCVILHALNDAWGSVVDATGRPRLHSFDISPWCYFDQSRPVGSAVLDMAPDLAGGFAVHDQMTAKDAAELFRDKPVTLAFIDGDHRHPFPTFDFFTLRAAVVPGSWVVLHDVELEAMAWREEERTGQKVDWAHRGASNLFRGWKHDKVAGADGAFNIGAIRTPSDRPVAVDELRPVIELPWETSRTHVRDIARDNPSARLLLDMPDERRQAAGSASRSFHSLPVSDGPGSGAKAKVCIVCSEFVGPHKNGGMGTAVTSLGLSLARHGHAVTFLYTRGMSCSSGTIEGWVRHYTNLGVEFVPLPASPVPLASGTTYTAQAYQVYQWLSAREFDVVHFPELEAPGYFCVVAKKQGLAFAATKLCVETHSPTRWLAEIQHEHINDTPALESDFMEQMEVALCDAVIGPSAYLLRWMEEKGWVLPQTTMVQQYVVPPHAVSVRPGDDRTARPVDEFVFFGRLEERKGLRLFCDALDRLNAHGRCNFRVSFLGKSARVGDQSGDAFLKMRGMKWTFLWKHYDSLNEKEAMEYLRGKGRCAVMPSLADNSPNTIYECIAAGIPFLAAHSGGIPELIAPEDVERVTFPVEASALASAMRLALDAGVVPPRPAVDFEANEKTWLRWHEDLASPGDGPDAAAGVISGTPDVSVCVAVEHGAGRLVRTLRSIQNQTRQPAEVILPDSEASREAADSVASGGRALTIRFADCPDGADQSTAMAESARARHLLLIDDTVALKPQAISWFAGVAVRTGADIVTSAIDSYASWPDGAETPKIVRRIVALGASPQMGTVYDAYGAGVLFVRRGRFNALGGLRNEGDLATRKRALCNKAALIGTRIETIPEALWYLEIQKKDPLTSLERYRQFKAVSHPFIEALPKPLQYYVDFIQGLRERAEALAVQLDVLHKNGAGTIQNAPTRVLMAVNVMIEQGDTATALRLLETAHRLFLQIGDSASAKEVKALLDQQRGKQKREKQAPSSGSKPIARNQQVLISVVIPCYNQAHFLPEAVESVLRQTFDGWELIVVNDGSQDNTTDAVRKMITQHPDRRIRLIEKPNGGLGSARNAGMKEAKGKYLLPLDADDRIAPTHLEQTLAVLESRDDVGFVYSHIQHFGERNDLWELPEFDARTIATVDNTGCVCSLIRKEVWETVGGYNETMRPQGYEDWDFWIGCIEKGWNGYRIPEPLFFYRIRNGSMLKTTNLERPYLFARMVLNHASLYDRSTVQEAKRLLDEREAEERRPAGPSMRISYMINSLLGVTGGNQTVLRQANALVDRGHRVIIVTYSDVPAWFPLRAQVIKVPQGDTLAAHVPPSDVVIATYFDHAVHLPAIRAKAKVYFAQGDQYIFGESDTPLPPPLEKTRLALRQMSAASYGLPGVSFVPNSRNLASAVERKYGRKADAVVPVAVDPAVFHPIRDGNKPDHPRILVVGPDTNGSQFEPLTFKGIHDIRQALEMLANNRSDFTVVRMSSTEQSIFKEFPCEFHVAPSDEVKTRLYGEASILVYASHYDSIPTPPLEAMAAGAAVVCTSTSGALEYCRDGENAILVPVKDPSALANAIERLLDDRSLREKLVKQGFETAARYTPERQWNELEGHLTKLVSPAPSEEMNMERLIASVQEMLKQARYKEALAELLKVDVSTNPDLSSDPQTKAAIENLKGFTHLALEEIDHAKASFERALQTDPTSSQACVGLGDVFLVCGYAQEAKTMYEWGVVNGPGNPRAAEGLAKANAALGLAPEHNSLETAEQQGSGGN